MEQTEQTIAAAAAQPEKAEAKKAFSSAAFSIILPLLGANVIFFILSGISWNLSAEGVLDQSFVESANYQFFLSTVPLLILGYPLFYLNVKKLPSNAPEKRQFKASQMITFFMMTVSVMFIGNIISTALAALLTSGKSENAIANMLISQQLIPTLYATLIAPVVEELFFRKLLIDKLSVYGEKWAIIFSALCFAMFHMNVYQIIYTFGMGLIFGYVYIKSGNVKNTILMHIGINLLGGVISPFAALSVDEEAVNEMKALAAEGKEIPEALMNAALPGLIIYVVYMVLLVAMVITGIVLFFVNRKKLHTETSEVLPTAKEGVPAILANGGMIVFIVISVLLMAVQLISPMLNSAAPQ